MPFAQRFNSLYLHFFIKINNRQCDFQWNLLKLSMTLLSQAIMPCKIIKLGGSSLLLVKSLTQDYNYITFHLLKQIRGQPSLRVSNRKCFNIILLLLWLCEYGEGKNGAQFYFFFWHSVCLTGLKDQETFTERGHVSITLVFVAPQWCSWHLTHLGIW